ncbi:immunoglobulin domain-containing protein [Mesoterricola silvestris]|uniref:PKD domain-containing protein n=1 Tax=Mesoterricola silvestris TaxID=2927979 RepID=A0AA48KD45_9BACT|nr:immunoglobulin domain-containing protein [Mesoterricola silvestris]BDU74138.1 hypothetical protein METEAL_33120 [Mesoterricola silvestris]
MLALRCLARMSLCLAVLGLGTFASPARAGGPDHDQDRHLGWFHKPDHLRIVTQPLSQTVISGQAVTFHVEVTGKPSRFHYQWLKGLHRVGGDSATLTLPATTAASAGVYTVIVSNPTGWVHSHPATLAINVPPVITSQPAGLTVVQGGAASFAVKATGNGTLGYQWRRGGAALAGATSAALSLPSVTGADAGSYDAVVTNTLNGTVTTATSAAALLQVNVPPVFTVQPVSQTVDLGAPLALSAAASAGQGSVTLQWRKDGQPIAGATSPEFALAAVTVADGGSYDAVATCTLNGTATSTVSQAAAVAVHAPPTLLTQPQSRTVLPPDGVTFTVTAAANHGGPLTYSWRLNGTPISGADGASYTVASTEFPTNGDAYSVVVGDGTFQVESANAFAVAAVPSPVYAGDPVPVPARPITVLPSLHVDAEKYPNGAFRLGYDESLKNPVWTSYLNFPVHKPYANSTKDYTADLRLAAPQVGKDDYTGIYTGGAGSPDSYDRGHQVPRADVSYRYSPVAGDDATIMSNLVPQISQFNQQLWQRLEETIGGSQGGDTDGVTSYMGRVWVYTGSYFPPSPAWWTSRVQPDLKIAIPTACYKIVVSEPTPGHPKALALILPNAWGQINAPATLTRYVTSVARIEALTGLDFFPNLQAMAPGLDIPAWKATVEVRGWRAPFEQASGPNVHMVEPSWDTQINVNDTVTFAGAATPSSASPEGTTLASATWNFGDGTPVSTGMTASHTYSLGGSFSASFTVQDSLGASNTITRVIKVKGPNEAPTFSGVANQTTTAGNPVTVSFTVADDTTAPGSLAVTATADNTVLLPSALAVVNASGTCSLALIPAAGLTGTATVTLTATDGDGASTTATFTLTVDPAGPTGVPSLIISQYYEGTSYNKWIEVTNVGTGTYDAAVTPLHLGLWTNPNTSNTFKTMPIPGTIAPGASLLFKSATASTPPLPDAAHLTNGAAAIANSTVINFNGNDAVYITTVPTATSASWDARIDAIGDLSWGAANPGADKSFYRVPSVLAGNPVYTAAEWIQKTMAEVENSTETDSFRLGYHVYNK